MYGMSKPNKTTNKSNLRTYFIYNFLELQYITSMKIGHGININCVIYLSYFHTQLFLYYYYPKETLISGKINIKLSNTLYVHIYSRKVKNSINVL